VLDFWNVWWRSRWRFGRLDSSWILVTRSATCETVVIKKTEASDKGLAYEHIHSSSEPILWISDAVAWSYGAGPDWRRRLDPIIDRVVRLDLE